MFIYQICYTISINRYELPATSHQGGFFFITKFKGVLHMKKIYLLASIGTALFALNANAGENSPYAAARLSFAHIRNNVNQWVDDRGFKSTIADKALSDNVFGGKLAVGTNVHNNLHAEIEYTLMDSTHNTGSYSHNVYGVSIPTNYKIEAKIQAVIANIYYDFDTGTKFTPYVSFGLGYSNIKEKASVCNQYAKEAAKDSEDSLAWNIGLGTSYAFSEKTTLELGYRYTDYGDKKDRESRGNYRSVAKRDYRASEILLGIRYSF